LGTVNLLGEKEDQVLISWDVDQLSLFETGIQNGELNFFSKKLPKGINKTTAGVYFASDITSTQPVSGSARSGFVIGGNPGVLIEYYHDGKSWQARPVKMRGGDLHVQTLSVPNWVDWDGDGTPDIIAGDASGYITFFKNKGSALSPVWEPGRKLQSDGIEIHHQAGLTGSIQGPNERRWGYTQPKVTDWDGDGLLDIVCNDITGKYVVYKNTGSSSSPSLSEAVQLTFKGTAFKAAWRSKPAILPDYFMKYNHSQSLPSMLAINGEGLLCLYSRSKTSPNDLQSQDYVLNTSGDPVRIVGFAGHEGRATLNICDFNKDGIWDILFGQGIHMYQSKEVETARPYSTAYVMINKGTNDSPRFDQPKPILGQDGLVIEMDRHGCWVDPVLNDKYEVTKMLAGGEDGRFYLFGAPQQYQSSRPLSETDPSVNYASTGSLEFYYGGVPVVYTTVRGKDGNIWLRQNLGSSRVAENRSDTASYGDLYVWGRWDDGHHFRSESRVNMSEKAVRVPSPNNPLFMSGSNPFYWDDQPSKGWWWRSGTSGDKVEASHPVDVTENNGCDPCRKLIGAGWRMPTIEEWEALRVAEKITDAASAFSSALKLPSATSRSVIDGKIGTNNNTTRIWSATAGDNGSAFVLHYHVNANSSNTTTNVSRGNGYPIRCIKD
jgi:uncharacterized protein (TIGR02145 family)